MKKTFFLFAALLVSLTFTASAMTPIQLRINGAELPFVQSANVPESMNEQFLKGVYCGMSEDLRDASLTITHFKQTDTYTIALIQCDDDYYVVTYRPAGGIIDGALLLMKNDIALACDFMNPRGNRMSAEEPTFALDVDKVSVTRNFVTQVNADELGGPSITEVGSVTMVYNVDKTGKMTVDEGSQHSQWMVAENGSVPGNHGGKQVTESDKCRTLGPGMNIISLYTMPVSQETAQTPDRLEVLYKQFDELMVAAQGNGAMQAARCLSELENVEEGLVLRNPQLWLDWLNRHSETRCMESLQDSLDDEDFKVELRAAVKSLKDKKLRKAWAKRLR